MSISESMLQSLESSSMVRKMFEEGAERKEKYGPGNVFDFSLGNPNLAPPGRFNQVISHLAKNDSPGSHGYMFNAGLEVTRQALASYLTGLNGHKFISTDVVMTVGAAGGLNVILKTILDPGDEVIIPKPYFMEYNAYVANYSGRVVSVPTLLDFSLDVEAIKEAITERTKVVFINNPNNPTGKVYCEDNLARLGAVLEQIRKEKGQLIYLISDEPYSKIIFNGCKFPSIFDAYEETFLVTSFSKDLSLAGERIGYIAVHPEMSGKEEVIKVLSLCNRILGFVNAPALMQRAIPFLLGHTSDMGAYKRNRDTFVHGLMQAGYELREPDGTFYLFPKSPILDDVEFVAALREENILTVPGSAFGGPGHFRIAYCVANQTIEKALPGFARVIKKFNGGGKKMTKGIKDDVFQAT